MHQLTQKLKSGEMTVQELPCPQVGPGMLLVRNHFSLVSAGTEGSTVKTARASLLAKARQRPQQVKQVLEVLRKQGPVQTYRAVMKKLDAYSPLGYSSAGDVIEVGERVSEFAVGDRVACAGAGYANHAEVVNVPVNLCVKLPVDADLRGAAYNTLGAIALQGVRQADLRLGESCAVIGLGLIGQLTCLLLRASGVRVFGVDVDSAAVATAARQCAEVALTRSAPGIADAIGDFSGGLGVDAVIITAGTSSIDPINFAGEIARKKGRVVVVGAVPTGFDRDPYFYRKELELRMSCSYGPGRYDPAYEEKGIDYPAAYVRWTEKRNMEAFQGLLHSGRISLDYLTTHEFSLEQAPQAYDMVVNRTEPFLGILLRYDVSRPIERKVVSVAPSRPVAKVGVAFIGAGSYAQGNLLPNLPKDDPDIVLKGVMTNSGTTSKRVAERFGFEFCASNESDILGNKDVNTVFIATRHDTHGSYVFKTLQAGKHVFVEKPLCLTLDELEEIKALTESKAESGNQKPETSAKENRAISTFNFQLSSVPSLMVGFNRRFAPLAVELKSRFGAGPVSMLYRVNAGSIPADHWIQDPAVGGGRLVGEVCHFVDFLTFISGSVPVQAYASTLPDPHHVHDTLVINLEFANGSIGSINYYANGAKDVDKEYFEAYGSGMTAILRDFKQIEVYGGKGKPVRQKLWSQDKGQKQMVLRFLQGIKEGGYSPIPFKELYAVTLATFAAQRSLIERAPVRLSTSV